MHDNSLQSIPNWLGKLKLNFDSKNGRSILIQNSHIGPFCVQKSFYPNNDNTTPYIYLLHPSGGLVGGDKLVLSAELEPNSQALLTTPSTSKFYSTNGMFAVQKYIFKLKKNSVLEWLPQGNIFFPKTRARIKTVWQLGQGARIIFFDMLCFQNIGISSTSNKPEIVDIALSIYLPNMIGLQDRFYVDALDIMTKLHGFCISANLFAIPANKLILNQTRELIKSVNNNQIGGATLLEEKLLVVRLLGNDNQKLIELLRTIWMRIRFGVIGKNAVIPRIWFT